MRKICFAFLISLVMCQVLGQGNYYIYIQSADHKPFYVRSGSRIFYSSGNGYLVMENLASASYQLMVGFPDTPSSEWQFNCAVNDDDAAFILKNDNGKKVEISGLKNESRQSGKKVELRPEKEKDLTVKQAAGIISDDPFSSMLAEVVNDPTIRQQPVIIPRPGDSLKLVKTIVADSAKLLVTNTTTPKSADDRKPATDSQAIAKTTVPPPAESGTHIETKSTRTATPDSNTAITKVAAVENRKAATEDKKAGKTKEDKTITATITDNNPEKKVVTDSAVSVTPKALASTEGEKTVLNEPVKEEKTAKPVAVQKAPAQSTAAANKSASAAELINAAMEEAEKKKQQEGKAGAEKIVLGASISIKKTLQRRSNEGMELIYNDQTDDGTLYIIRILIPANNK